MLNWIVAGLNGVNGQAVVFYVGVVLRHASEIVTIQRQSPAEDLARELPKFFNRVTLQRYALVSIVCLKKGHQLTFLPGVDQVTKEPIRWSLHLPLQAIGVNPFPRRFINRTVP